MVTTYRLVLGRHARQKFLSAWDAQFLKCVFHFSGPVPAFSFFRCGLVPNVFRIEKAQQFVFPKAAGFRLEIQALRRI